MNRLQALVLATNLELKNIGCRGIAGRFDVNYVDAVKYVNHLDRAHDEEKKSTIREDPGWRTSTAIAARLIAYAIMKSVDVDGIGSDTWNEEFPYDLTITITPHMEGPSDENA